MAEQDEQKQGGAAGGASEFETMFEESLRTVKPGGVVKGRVVGVTATHVLIDVGYKSEGQIPIQEFTDRQGNVQVKVGDDVDVYFDSSESEGGGIVLSRQRAENLKIWEDLEKAFNEELGVEGHIIGKVKGGFKVDVMGVPAFLPGSHVDIRPSRNLDRFIGTTDRFAILKFNRARGNVVVSRRALLEKERETLKKDILKVLEEGVILEGTVKNITGYGAFVDLGGIDGILHISDMSWGRINHPSEIVEVGEKIKVVVLKFDTEKERISLGMKQLTPDPWHTVAEKYPVGSRVQGKVISLMDYGAYPPVEDPPSRPAGRGRGIKRRCGAPQNLPRALTNHGESLGGGEGKVSGGQHRQGASAEYHRLRHLRRHRRRDRRSGSYLGLALDQETEASIRTL